MNLLEKNEHECLEEWRHLSSLPLEINSDHFWVEWDPFLNVSVIQYDKFVFAKLRTEHEH